MQVVYDNNRNQAFVSMQEHLAHMNLLQRLTSSTSKNRSKSKHKSSIIQSKANISQKAITDMKVGFLERQKNKEIMK